MMNILKKLIQKRFLIIVIFTFLSTTVEAAQITFSDDVDDMAPQAPIDGFIGIALAAGAVIGLRNKIKKEE